MYKFFKRLIKPDREGIGYLLSKGAIIIDVRTPGEFRNGHAEGAINIPLHHIPRKIETIKSYHKPIITCCSIGMRAERASARLRAAGIEVHTGGPWQYIAAIQRNRS